VVKHARSHLPGGALLSGLLARHTPKIRLFKICRPVKITSLRKLSTIIIRRLCSIAGLASLLCILTVWAHVRGSSRQDRPAAFVTAVNGLAQHASDHRTAAAAAAGAGADSGTLAYLLESSRPRANSRDTILIYPARLAWDLARFSAIVWCSLSWSSQASLSTTLPPTRCCSTISAMSFTFTPEYQVPSG
jgi:hypothetical protein